jgi:hypothetical protein
MSEPEVQLAHGASELEGVRVDSYNAEIRDQEGFIGDRASGRAFGSILENWRERMRKASGDPLDGEPNGKVSRSSLDELLLHGDVEPAGLVLSAVEEFAQELNTVCQRLLQLGSWRRTEAIIVGGGFRGSRIGELAIGRASVLLKAEGLNVSLRPIHHDPDLAGLLGSAWLLPHRMMKDHDGILGVDIGGSTIRAGLVVLTWRGGALSEAQVAAANSWPYRDAEPGRDETAVRLIDMLRGLISQAEQQQFRLAPLIGIGCPGLINSDGTIARGGQNLPGNWEAPRFNLPRLIQASQPMIDHQPIRVLLHNDAVVQGLSELPYMAETKHWGVLTIGTGLGNPHFSAIT